ncbi:MAG: hypothetical protein JSV42_08280 [Chloroflexota bacterium]|nr:MAG: hypothetical protein JSV42_08280 [Chloroflexota bacterium]
MVFQRIELDLLRIGDRLRWKTVGKPDVFYDKYVETFMIDRENINN